MIQKCCHALILKELKSCFIDSELKFSFRYLSNFDNFLLRRAWCNSKVLLCPHSITIELLVTQNISFHFCQGSRRLEAETGFSVLFIKNLLKIIYLPPF